MTRHIIHRTIDNLLVPVLIAGGLLIAPLVVHANPMAQEPAPSQEEPSEQSQPLESVTGTLLIQEEDGNRSYHLDIDGDSTADVQLEFQSASQRSALPNAGEQVTVTGTVQGQTLTVHEVHEGQKQ